MPIHAYFIQLETRDAYSVAEYAYIAGQLANCLQQTLGNFDTLVSLTVPDLSDAHVEVEVHQIAAAPEAAVLARALLKVEASGEKMPFNKTKFTKMMRQKCPFLVKVTKQAVPMEESPA